MLCAVMPWERRLKDLAQLLDNCDRNYYDPELFRLNTNNFLQTARTVTFLIQKQKDAIPDFGRWYDRHVVTPWRADHVMIWAKDSRNQIEKEGDLELNSQLTTTLICSYLDEENIHLRVGKPELLAANMKRLIRFAQKQLPSGAVESAVLKVERRWVANALPSFELLAALAYVYARTYEVCAALAEQVGSDLSAEIRHPDDAIELGADVRRTAFIKLRGGEVSHLKFKRLHRDKTIVLPDDMTAVSNRLRDVHPTSLETCVAKFAEMAEVLFKNIDMHYPALFLLDETWRVVDQLNTVFAGKADKFIFWHHVADRVVFARARAVVWISEAWHHDMRGQPYYRAIHDMPIVGEMLQVCGIDWDGNFTNVTWNIHRDDPNGKPRIELDGDTEKYNTKPFFFAPVERAFEKLRHGSMAGTQDGRA